MFQDISISVEEAFAQIGLDRNNVQVVESNRPDLSDLQCNAALQGAKLLKRPPREIAESVKQILAVNPVFSRITVDGPGFLNLTLSDTFILEQLKKLMDKNYQHNVKNPQKIVIDYGGPNVAKPLHVGHLRSAIIGESIKRMGRMLGHEVVADVHLGDWGTPMGMLIADLQDSHPEWPYFDRAYEASQNDEAPLTAEELNALYPQAAKRFKEDDVFKDTARKATADLQDGHPGYRALWKHFVNLSVQSIKEDFAHLDVSFDLWLGESDADPHIPTVTKDMNSKGLLRESDGAIVVDVAREDDKYEIPPMIWEKKDGAVTYAATDLATIFQRVHDYNPDRILYVVDQRQGDHFQQVFRAAANAGYIGEERLEHIGFGTMNGADGKPYKTRAGGVMRLSDLIKLSLELAQEASGFSDADVDKTKAKMIKDIAIGAIKYGDLRNPRISDYVFDPKQLVSFEGNTGPYIQYAAVRAKAILEKSAAENIAILPENGFSARAERQLALNLVQYPSVMESAFNRRLPSDLCVYAQTLSRAFSGFYTDCPIVSEKDASVRQQRLALTEATHKIVNNVLQALAISAPEKMLKAETPAPHLT